MYHWHTAFGWPSPGIVWAKGHASPAEQPLLRKNLHGTWPSASFFFVDSLALASALPAFGGACLRHRGRAHRAAGGAKTLIVLARPIKCTRVGAAYCHAWQSIPDHAACLGA